MREQVGPYHIQEALGRGGMGVVYRGVHEALARQVAIKALAPELTRDPQFRERFFSEARTQAHLQHPNIITIYDLLEDEGEFFIVMELVQGEGLDRRLECGRLAVDDVHSIFGQILSALDAAHSQGVIHRDVKASNVLVTDDGRVKLMDFGIALLVGDKRLTQSSQTIGTPVYMSPEQILRPRDVDHRTDIYSAGILLYEMLTGTPPFDAETEYEIKKHHIETPFADIAATGAGLAPDVAAVLAQALAKDPDQRFDSAGEFLRALGGGPGFPGNGSGATPHPAPPPAPRATRFRAPAAPRRPRLFRDLRPLVRPLLASRRLPWIAAAALVVLGVLGALAIGLRRAPEAGDSERTGRPILVATREAPAGPLDALDLPDDLPPPPFEEEGEEVRPPSPSAGAAQRPVERARSEPVPAPAPEPQPRPEPVDEPEPAAVAADAAEEPSAPADAGPTDADERLRDAGRLARELPEAIERFQEHLEDRIDTLEDHGGSSLWAADYQLQEALGTLRTDAETLKQKYNAIASRENLDGKKGPLRWLRGKLGTATREEFWKLAGRLADQRERAARYASAAGSLDGPGRAQWNQLASDLQRLDRYARPAGGG